MEEDIIKRMPPHNMEAERSVIGSMLMDVEAISVASEILKPDCFYAKQHKILFEAMIDLYGESKAVDLVTLKARLELNGAPPEISSVEFIRELLSSVPTSTNVKYYANIVNEKAVLRNIIKVNNEITEKCYAGHDKTETILNETEKKVFDLIQSKGIADYVPIRQVVVNVLDKIETAAKTSGNVTGVPSGFLDLDYKTAGFQPSDLILLAARPAMGKTAFVLNIAEHIVIKQKMSAVVFSLEMSKEQLVNRLLSQESRVDAGNIRTGNLKDDEWERLIESASVIGNSKLIIDDTSSISVSELRSKCRKFKLEHDIKVIIIDYLQLMSGSGKNESRQQEVSDISRSLKGLARELNVPVIALSQLSRAVESRPDKRPMLSDLRESGAIEQDADMVMFLYRDDYYNPETEEKNIAEIIISKQRHGTIGTVKLMWLPNYTKFANLDRSK